MSVPFRLLPPQEPAGPAAPAADAGVLDWLWSMASRPGVVETLLALAMVVLGFLLWRRLVRVVDGVRSRALLQDYLLGVEQALAGDLKGAHARLTRVLEADPENHYARLLLGKVLAERGEPAQAHKHHLYLQRAFAVESGENDLQLARALLLCGRPAEAADAAERVAAADPRRAPALEFLFRARLQAGDPEAAATVGRKLLALSRTPPQQLKADVATALAQAGEDRLRRGDALGARPLLEQARSLAAEQTVVRRFAARLDAAARGLDAMTEELLQAPPGSALPVPAAGGLGLPAATGGELVASPGTRWLPALVPLLPQGRWRCGVCRGELPGASAECPRCGAQGRAEVDEPRLFQAIGAPAHLADAIEANQAHVRRTVRAAVQAADGEPGDPDRRRALDLGELAVPELLHAACGSDPLASAAAIALLQQLGPSVTPALFAAADDLEDRRLLPIGSSPVAAVVGRVVQGFDRTALPHVEALFSSARPSSRKILIDYFLGLADPDEFQVVLERFPPLEIIGRLNKVDAAVLQRFLQAVPERSFVAEVLLLESTFYREGEILAAIPGAQHPEVLEQVLIQRGPSRTLVGELVQALADERLQPVALRVLRAFSSRVQDHLLAAFVDRDRESAVRADLAGLLSGLGPAAVERLCASFGPEPTSLDDELCTVLGSMGDAAVPALQTAYTRPGWVERMTVGLFGRGSNRRAQIVRVLTTLGTDAAHRALRMLREHETDPNMKLRLQQAIHRLDERRLQGERADESGPHEGDREDRRPAAQPPTADAGDREDHADADTARDQDGPGGRHGQTG